MRLILVRHAIAKQRSAERWRDDAERPLSALGERRFRRAAPGLAELAGKPAAVYCSPSRRTRQTAAMLTELADWPDAQASVALSPGVEPRQVLELLAPLRADCVALIGHEPELGRLASLLICGRADGARLLFKKGGAAAIALVGSAAAGKGELLWLLPPRALRGLGARGDDDE